MYITLLYSCTIKNTITFTINLFNFSKKIVIYYYLCSMHNIITKKRIKSYNKSAVYGKNLSGYEVRACRG